MHGMFRRNQRPKKASLLKKSEAFEAKLWHKLTNNKFLMLLLTGLAIMFSTTFVYVYKGVQSDLDSFAYVMLDTVNSIENATILCNTTTVDTPMMQYYLADKLFVTRQDLLNNMGNLLKQRSALGRHISYKTYLESASLICWGNALFVSGAKLCNMSTLLKPSHRMDTWRKYIVNNVISDKENHQQLWVIFKDYSTFVTSLVSIRKAVFEDSYPQAPKCDIDNISQHIDSLENKSL